MKSKKWLGALLATTMVLSSSIALVGCGKSESGKSNDTENAKKDEDQFLNILFVDDPRTLDVNKASDSESFQVLTQVNEGLARILPDDKGEDKVTPAGAESWEKTDNDTVWTFKLRKDAKWSDGKPVTAQQYVDSMLRLLDKKNGFEYSYFAFDIKNAESYYEGKIKAEEVGIKAKDDYTLVMTLAKPAPHFEKKLAFCSFFPVRLDVIKAGGENWENDFKKHVFNGPFVIKEWVKNNSMTLEKNENYWDAKNVSLKKVEMKDVKEFSTQAQLFESYQLDVSGARNEFIEKWKKAANEGKFKFMQGKYPSVQFMSFNQSNGGPSGIMKNAKIRKALSLSIDREEFLNTLYGRYIPAYGLVPEGIKTGDVDFRKEHKEDLKTEYEKYKGKNEELQAIFKEGLKELGKSDDLSAVTLKFVTTGDTAFNKSVQEYWQQTWEKKLGIKVKMEIVGDNKILNQAKKDLKYDIVGNGWHGDYDDPMTFVDLWLTGSSYSATYGGYSNPKYDELFKKLDGEKDNKKREEIYAQLEKILIAEDYGIAPYMYQDTMRFMHNYVKGMSFPMFGPTYEFSRAYTAGRPAK